MSCTATSSALVNRRASKWARYSWRSSIACVVRSRGLRAARPSLAYFARVAADRAPMALWRCCSGLFAASAASRARATPKRVAGAAQTSRNLRIFGTLACPGIDHCARCRCPSCCLPPMLRPRAAFALVVLGSAVLASTAGCGHPASEAECQTIVERIVELELKAQNVTDPAEVAKRRTESLGLSGDRGRAEVLQGCVGTGITDRCLQ